MAFADPISLADAKGTPVTHLFTKRDGQTGRSEWMDTVSNTSAERYLLSLKHMRAGRNVAGNADVRRHLLQLQFLGLNTTLQKDETATVNMTLLMPETSSVITRAVVNDLLKMAANFMNNSGYIDRLVRDET